MCLNPLWSKLYEGAQITARRPDGGLATGRAEFHQSQPNGGYWYVRTGPIFSVRVTESNLLAVEPRRS